MSDIKKMNQAKQNKKNEFYTQLRDIQDEMRHYKPHFKGKTVYCNCDDPRVSKFFHYFLLQFEPLGLKKLIGTCYKSQNWDLFSKHDSEKAVYLTYEGDKSGNKMPDDDEIAVLPLQGNGDFRSPECIKFLKEADIVVTNPPFSLFRQYVAQLMEYNKQFLIIGNMNAITYKDTFAFIKEGKMWLGCTHGPREYGVPEHYELTGSSCRVDEHGKKYITIPNTCWFTNLEHSKRNEKLQPVRKYNAEEYLHYENYDAINVDKVNDIPIDWDGDMGVPISFLFKWNPNQFEIIGIGISNSGLEVGVKPYKPEHKKYRREVQKCAAVDGDLYMMVDGKVKLPYRRILIRNKNQKTC